MENTVEDILCTRPPTSMLDPGTDPTAMGGRLLWPELMNEGTGLRKRPGRFVYAKRVVFNGVNAALLGATFLSSVAFQSMIPLATFLGAQAMLAVLAPRIGVFRRIVNRRIEADQDAALARHRATILMQMSERHRHVFEAMEMMVRRIRNESTVQDGRRRTLVNIYLEVERLLATYATLGLIHRKTHDHLTLGAANLRQAPPPDPDGSSHGRSGLDAVISRRNEIQRKRRVVRECNQERMVTMEQQMGAIQDLICLVYEHVATDTVGAAVMNEIEEVLQGLSQNDMTTGADWDKTGAWQSPWAQDAGHDGEAAPVTELKPVPSANEARPLAPARELKSLTSVNGGTYRSRHADTRATVPHTRR